MVSRHGQKNIHSVRLKVTTGSNLLTNFIFLSMRNKVTNDSDNDDEGRDNDSDK